MTYCIQIVANLGVGYGTVPRSVPEEVSGKPYAKGAIERNYIKVLTGGTLGGRKSEVLRSDTSYKTVRQSASEDHFGFADHTPGMLFGAKSTSVWSSTHWLEAECLRRL